MNSPTRCLSARRVTLADTRRCLLLAAGCLTAIAGAPLTAAAAPLTTTSAALVQPDSEATVTTGDDGAPTLPDTDETTVAETTDEIDPNTLTTIGVAPASQPFASQPTATEGAIDANGTRLLAGADRYATSVLLASVPLDAGDARADDLIVVSGESLVDAVSAVSVAASRDAAIVLTQTDGLPDVVSEFITDRGFDTVTVGGGTAAVSDAAAGELAALVNDANGDAPSGGSSDAAGDASGVLSRVEGATRYETAVNAARAAGNPGVWCDGRPAALLVSGESLVDGVIAAPVAYAMGLPLLFTEPDALPEAVTEYLTEAGIERAVVVGSTSDVSAAVLAQIEAAVAAVHAFDADTPAARSVELATAIEDCATQPVAAGQYALLDSAQPVDGVAAAAALATGLGAHADTDALSPILAVNQDDLPAVVAEHLAEASQRHQTITLYPLGGVARLTPRVITSALAAARGSNEGDTDDDAGGAAGVDVSDAALIAAGLTPGKSDGTGVAVGVGVVIADGVIRLEPTYQRYVSAPREQTHEHLKTDDALPVLDEWFASPGVVDPYLWQPEIPVLAAGVDHDGDGVLSADERYPLGSPERAAYMVASGGQAPPGAKVLAVPDMISVGGSLNEGRRNTAARYPADIPVPPGAPDRLTTTFEERDAERKQRFEAYSGGQGFGRWDRQYRNICASTPEGALGWSPLGITSTTDGVTCETAADWYLWMCDTMNDPLVASLDAPQAWLETFRRFYAQWESQLAAPWMWHEGLEDAVIAGAWEDEVNSPRCVYADRAELDAANAAIVAWGSDPDLPYSSGNNRSRMNPDSAFWDWAGNRMTVLRDVAEAEPRSRGNLTCRRDVRWCDSDTRTAIWGLRALD